MRTLKNIVKNWQNKKLLTTLRIFSLFIGIGVSLYILELNAYEKSYDNFWTNPDKIYRVTLKHEDNGELITHSARNFLGVPFLLKNEMPGIKSAVGFSRDVINIFCNEQQFNEVHWQWTDTSFFSVLDRKILLAESNDFWNDLHTAVISASFAKKLYGDKNPINQRFTLNEGWEYQVKAVFEDLPENSHLKVDVLASRASLMYYVRNFNNTTRRMVENPNYSYNGVDPYHQWAWNTRYETRRFSFIRLNENTTIEQVKAAIPEAMKKVTLPARYANSTISFEFQPITDIHLKSNLEQEYQPNGSEARVRFLYLIAFVVLVVSIINFLNLSNIQVIESGKKYAIHILNGARLKTILRLIFLDNIIVVAIAVFIGVALLFSLKEIILKQSIIHLENIFLILAILAVVALIGVFLSYFSSLKGRFQSYIKTSSGSLPGNWSGRKTLVVVQFTIAVVLIAGTILIQKQMNFMSNYRLGFEPKQTMFSFSPMSMNWHPELRQRLTTFKNEVLKVPGVDAFSISSSVPGREVKRFTDNVKRENKAKAVHATFTLISASEDYLKLFDIKLLTGRNFRPQPNWNSNEILINQTALKSLGYINANAAIGKIISVGDRQSQIVGVINDYHHVSLKKALSPLIIENNLRWEHGVGFYTIRFDAKRTREVLAQVSEIWERIYPIEVASFHYTDQVFEAQYNAEQKFQKITTYGSLLALLISCIGLFAIAAFDTQKRIKEIGVRKVNGAKVVQVMNMLNTDFMKWVTVGIVLACPLAWYAMNKWLEGFAYRTELSWWIFALAGVLAIAVAFLTISWKSWRAATRNPVEALRCE